jgi:phasin family protein
LSDSKSKRVPRSRAFTPLAVEPGPIAAAVEPEAAIEAAVAAEIAATTQPPTAGPPIASPPIADRSPEAPEAPPAPEPIASSAEDFFTIHQTALGVFAESQTAVARGLEALALETAALARSGFSTVADTATALLGARTFADAVEVQAGFTRRSIDAALDGSARLSEIAAKTAAEASRPILSRLEEAWRNPG